MHDLCIPMVRKASPGVGSGGQQIEHFAFRAGADGARIRNQRAESSRSQVSDPNLVHKHAISRAGVGDHFRKSFRCRLELGSPRPAVRDSVRDVDVNPRHPDLKFDKFTSSGHLVP
jgi:hypothetical protein